ncbi:hypothetical protein GCM10011380_15490 [Sphingomonas metalli]|uniref:Bacteriophage Mu GpT domain-containing protein n=1 Tax=Sphingomonas metalli TaxID=1779358 RepID=A0A916T1J9_9SPHN|nr:prohead protease/major capsid protein fusion protein [Sphingomonas metalli]GGB26828.1 hypothetical protein GCM10011380_15490 [Sphingomonas metalli]
MSSSNSSIRQRYASVAPTSASAPRTAQAHIADMFDRYFAVRGQRDQGHAPLAGERLVSAPQRTRELSLSPQSWNEAARTVDVIWTTGARGARFSWDTLDLVDEELATDSANVRLDRLNSGAPVLNTHQKGDLGAQIGTVVPGSARMAGGKGMATLKLSDRADVAPIVADIAAGIIRNLSVGYTVHTFEVDPKARPRPLYRAVDWEPTEISFVPVPFDAGAQVRDLSLGDASPCLIRTISQHQEPQTMSTPWYARFTRGREVATPPVAPMPQTATRDYQQQPISYDQPATIGWLRSYVDTARSAYDLPAEICGDLVLEMAERQLSEGDARDSLLHIVAERQRQQTSGVSRVGSALVTPSGSPSANALVFGHRTYDDPNFHAGAVEDALFARMSGTAPSDQARAFMSMSMVQIAGELLSRSGVHNVNRMAPNDVLNAAAWNSGGARSYMTRADGPAGYHTTSDFPELLLGAGNRFLLNVFTQAESPLKQLSRQRQARDFRAISGLELSGFSILPEVPESGEIKHGTFRERKESYALRTFAKQFALSRQAIINDDLAAFADPMVIMARAAAETEASLLADLVNGNPVMSDGIPLFDARHGNVAVSGGAPSVEALDAGRQAMRKQKGLDGTPIAPKPKFIVSGIENETTIEKLMTGLTAGTADAANPFAGKLVPAVDPRLAPKAWYLFGDPATSPTLEHAYLNDQTGPVVEQKDGWDVLGTQFRVYMDFGAGAVDWRGAYKDAGAAG